MTISCKGFLGTVRRLIPFKEGNTEAPPFPLVTFALSARDIPPLLHALRP